MALEKTPLLGQEGQGGGPGRGPYRVTYLPVDHAGLLKLADLEAAIPDQTALASLMWANNETGVLFPVEQIAGICRSRGVLYHCDAVHGGQAGPELAGGKSWQKARPGHSAPISV